MEEEKRLKREEEIVETALAVAATALLVSGLKKLLPCVLNQWVPAALLVAPPQSLLLLLNLVIASIVAVSLRPRGGDQRSADAGRRRRKKKRSNSKSWSSATAEEKESRLFFVPELGKEGEEEGDGAGEVDARAEAFIVAFRRQLRLDSASYRIVH